MHHLIISQMDSELELSFHSMIYHLKFIYSNTSEHYNSTFFVVKNNLLINLLSIIVTPINCLTALLCLDI